MGKTDFELSLVDESLEILPLMKNKLLLQHCSASNLDDDIKLQCSKDVMLYCMAGFVILLEVAVLIAPLSRTYG